MVVKLVEEYRGKGLKRTGTRKLYHNLKVDLVLAGINVGRDALHHILLGNGLTIKAKRRAFKTTITHASYRKWPDRRQGLKVLASKLLWCADISYIRIQDGFVYLSLIQMNTVERSSAGVDAVNLLQVKTNNVNCQPVDDF